MDSIITQVQRPEEQQQQEPFDENDTKTPSQTSTEKQSKSKRLSFFRSILSCILCRKKKKSTAEALSNEELLQTESNGTATMVNNGATMVSGGMVMSAGSGSVGSGIGSGDRNDGYLLPPHPNLSKPTMIIDLDETLVHSSFKPISNADFIVPVEIDGTVHQVYVAKRPYVDEFLEKMGPLYECVLFTASLAKYADPVADLLDKWGVFKARLFREACVYHRGNYVKDLNKLGRSLHRVIIVDNSPASYIFHPDNAVPVASWFDDASDTELLYLIPFFERLATVDNVYTVLRNSNHPFNTPPAVMKDIVPGFIASTSS